MRFLKAYLRQRLPLLICLTVFCTIFAGSFYLYGLPLKAVWYPAALCLLIGLLCLGIDFSRTRRRHCQLLMLEKHCADLLSELPKSHDLLEEDYQRLLSTLRDQMRAQQAEASTRYHDMMEYYTVWVHQIKTPIASMRLMLQGEDSALSLRLSLELARIEQYVEMVLAYLRLDASTNDFVFCACRLDKIVRQSVRKFASEFIARKLQLVYEPTELQIVSDEKWLGFVLDQLLSNALKYTQEGTIHIYMDGQVLCIADSGIGIAPEDLPRVFEKGYTGYNGRRDHHATGIGLYLCRRVCRKLGVCLSAESELGKGTTMRLDLSQEERRAD